MDPDQIKIILEQCLDELTDEEDDSDAYPDYCEISDHDID